MTEKQILAKIEKWDKDNKVSAIIEFIENLPVQQKTSQVLSELGRAYNNFYWLMPSEENRAYLQKAVSVFNYVKDDIPSQIWHYRIGYAYFFLDNIEKAKEHLSHASEGNGKDLLEFLKIAEQKGLKPTEVAPQGALKFEFLFEKFIALIQEKAPALVSVLGKGASDTTLDAFEQRMGINLPEDVRYFYKTFDGQTDNNVFFLNNAQRFISIQEVEELQKRWLSFVVNNYGKNWQDLTFSSDDFFDDDIIKNQLFSQRWIPFLMQHNEQGNEEYLCFDFDSINEEDFGQLISVSLSDKLQSYYVDYVSPNIWSWLYTTTKNIEEGFVVYDEKLNSLMFTTTDDFSAVYYTEEELDTLKNYISENIGQIDDVLPGLISSDIRCDIYIIKPTPERNYYTLITGGMGAFDMLVPQDHEGSTNAELMINLPPDWNVYGNDEKDFWPIRWLKTLAQLPIEQQTFLDWGHTIPTGEPLPDTPFTCLMLIGSETKDRSNALVTLPTGRQVQFFTLVPLYEEEMLYKLQNMAEALIERFEAKAIPYPPVVDVNRLNVCENFVPSENHAALDGVAWAFNKINYVGLMQFWDDVRAYNEYIEQDLDYFNPFTTLFKTSKVKVIYEAWVRSEKDLLPFEEFVEPIDNVFNEYNEQNGFYQAEIIAELQSGDNNSFGALELLWNIHNCLQNKELGDNIFFEGFEIEGYEDDITPVIYLCLGD